MKSVIQKNEDICYLCKLPARFGEPLDCHHVFFGPLRKKSDQYELTVRLHHNSCHIFGENAVHKNAKINRALQAHVQKKAMKHYGWTIDDFRSIFGKNFI